MSRAKRPNQANTAAAPKDDQMNRELAWTRITWKKTYTAMYTNDKANKPVTHTGRCNSWRKAPTRNNGPSTSNQIATS
jgi:hypothetical protein